MQKTSQPTQERRPLARFFASFDADTIWWIAWYFLVWLAFAALALSLGMMLVACQMEFAKAAAGEPTQMVGA